MITLFRRYLETWPVRLFFGIMVLSFVVWGIGDVVRNIGRQTWLARAGGDTIEPQQFQSAFQRDLTRAQQQLPPGQDMTRAMRASVADQALARMIGDIAMTKELRRLRIVVPDAALRQAVFEMPAFRDKSGRFDRAQLDSLLRSNGLSEAQFLAMVRSQLAEGQLMEAVSAGATPPGLLVTSAFAFETERRAAKLVEIPFAAAPAPPAPAEPVLRRWYANHPEAFRIPEFRKIKAVVLSPETLDNISDNDLRAWYDQHKAQLAQPAKRSVQVAMAPDPAKAKALATLWSGGADWVAIQKAAQTAGGSAVELDGQTEQQIPDAELAKAVFAAPPTTVAGPVKTALGSAVLKVLQADPGSEKSFDQAKDEVRQRVLAERSANLLYDGANKVDNILGTGAGFDKLPSDLGLLGVAGTLDADGNTKDGAPAPIPGPPELRKALIAAAFGKQAGEQPSELTEVQTPSAGGSVFYAVQVEATDPPSRKPFEQVKDQVQADWTKEAQQHAAETQAAQVLTAVQAGQSLEDAATKAGV
ncbi:MAG: SurA N-terminal domain-containing protein, partial [Pseudomonadota bacterium]|nr:SurA N-terminal domain-containing protein [Pseudomonadota bacterium]